MGVVWLHKTTILSSFYWDTTLIMHIPSNYFWSRRIYVWWARAKHFGCHSVCLSVCFPGKFGCFGGKRKGGKIYKTKEATPTKTGLHAIHINLYLHDFFEPILFFTPMDNSLNGKLGHFWRQTKNCHIKSHPLWLLQYIKFYAELKFCCTLM